MDWVLINLAIGTPLFARVMSTLARVMGSIFWKKLFRKVYGFFLRRQDTDLRNSCSSQGISHDWNDSHTRDAGTLVKYYTPHTELNE